MPVPFPCTNDLEHNALIYNDCKEILRVYQPPKIHHPNDIVTWFVVKLWTNRTLEIGIGNPLSSWTIGKIQLNIENESTPLVPHHSWCQESRGGTLVSAKGYSKCLDGKFYGCLSIWNAQTMKKKEMIGYGINKFIFSFDYKFAYIILQGNTNQFLYNWINDKNRLPFILIIVMSFQDSLTAIRAWFFMIEWVTLTLGV